jgi:polyphosphate glucokinase
VEILGIDIGGSGIKGAPVDLTTGQLLAERFRLPTPQPSTPEAVVEAVAEVLAYFRWEAPFGCTIPARIRHGVVRTAANIDKSWMGVHISQLLEKRTGQPNVVLNDADAAGLADMAYGAGRGHTGVVMMLTVGTGIGSALFVNGELVPNTELGHLEMNGKDAEMQVSDRTRKERELSWDQWAKRFQQYLDWIEFLFSPDLIILGGSVSRPKKKDLYLPLLKTEAQLVTAHLENEAGIVGAAWSARHLLFHEDHNFRV